MMVDVVFFWFQKVLISVFLWVLPVLIVAVLVGLLISLFQIITQIHDAALSFVPKFLVAMAFVILGGPLVFRALAKLFQEIVNVWGRL